MLRLPACLCLLAMQGCALPGRPPLEVQEAEVLKLAMARRPLQPAGKIVVVNVKDGFVLIDGGVHPTPAARTKLRGYTGPLETSALETSEVRRRPFVVADILSGAPQQGDEVFLRGEPPPAQAVAAP